MIFLVALGFSTIDGSVSLASGFGRLSTRNLFFTNSGLSLAALTLIANLPQLGLSAFSFVYNGVYTSMLLSREWTSFALRRSSLRVSQPRGLQRRAHTLSIPFRFAVPLLAMMAASHWVQSQALFLARIEAYDADRCALPVVQCLGYSPVAWVTMIAMQASLILLLVGVGCWRYPAGIPIVRGCSLAISAACHPPPERAGNESRQRLQYGLIDDADAPDGGRVGLSSGAVRPLDAHETYGQGVTSSWFWGSKTRQTMPIKSSRRLVTGRSTWGEW